MNPNAATAQLGWKTSDEGKRAPAHQLDSDVDIDNTFKIILDIQSNLRRKKGVVLEIIHLNPAPILAKKKNDGTRACDFAYGDELRIVKEKLKCAQHTGPNHWCYVPPTNPDEHIALGLEEITLWAHKIHDNDADADCILLPDCLSLDALHDCKVASRIRRLPSQPKPEAPPIHIHFSGNPLGDTSCHNMPAQPPGLRGLKRTHSVSDSSDANTDSDEEALPLSDVLDILHYKYPKLNLPQYMQLFENEKIVYAETILQFDRDYFAQLGVAEGAIHALMSGVRKTLHREEKQRKRTRARRERSYEV